MNKEIELKETTQDLATLFLESWMYPTRIVPENFKDFVVKMALDNGMDLEDFEDEEDLKENWDRIIDGHEIHWLILYLYNEGKISDNEMKDMIQGNEFGTSCYGDYIKRLESKFGVIVNKK